MNEILQKLYTEFQGIDGINVMPYFSMIRYLVETEQTEELNTRLNDLKEAGYLSEEYIEKINSII